MFLNPTILGVPEYLGGRVVITRVGERVGFGFVNSCILVCGIFRIKAMCRSSTTENIWRNDGRKKSLDQALIGINSPTTRAIKKILMVPGLNLPKIVFMWWARLAN